MFRAVLDGGSILHGIDPKHAARVTKGRFSFRHIHVIEWPRQSPDLHLLRICCKARELLPSGLTELELIYTEKWATSLWTFTEMFVKTLSIPDHFPRPFTMMNYFVLVHHMKPTTRSGEVRGV